MTETDRIELNRGSHSGLAWSFQVNPDSCENHTHYENYIKFVAVGDRNAGRGTTHVFLRGKDDDVKMLGYITFRAASYIKSRDDGVPVGDPALEISELAVSKDAEREGVGSLLMKFAFATALELNMNALGIRYITVCADRKAVGFYKDKFSFAKVSDYGELPREGWNNDCVPMFLRLPDLPE